MMTIQKRIVALAGIVLALGAAPIAGADLPLPGIDATTLRQELDRAATLYLIRASFDVISADDVPSLLLDDAKRLEDRGLQPEAATALSEALTAEGSYYITSLRYLIGVGGANWPTDRNSSAYDAETLQKLADLQHQWLAAVSARADLKGLLLAIDQINAQTEGDTDLPPALDHFESLDRLVDAAIASVTAKPAA